MSRIKYNFVTFSFKIKNANYAYLIGNIPFNLLFIIREFFKLIMLFHFQFKDGFNIKAFYKLCMTCTVTNLKKCNTLINYKSFESLIILIVIVTMLYI